LARQGLVRVRYSRAENRQLEFAGKDLVLSEVTARGTGTDGLLPKSFTVLEDAFYSFPAMAGLVLQQEAGCRAGFPFLLAK